MDNVGDVEADIVVDQVAIETVVVGKFTLKIFSLPIFQKGHK